MQWCKCLKNSIKSFMVNLCVVSDTLEMNWICDLSIGWSSDSVFTPFKLMLSSNGKFVQTTERYTNQSQIASVSMRIQKRVFWFTLLLFAQPPSSLSPTYLRPPPPPSPHRVLLQPNSLPLSITSATEPPSCKKLKTAKTLRLD